MRSMHNWTVFCRCSGDGSTCTLRFWVIKHNGCGVVNHNVGRLITHGKEEIDAISSHNGLGSDWNGCSICRLNMNGIARENC